MLSVSGSGDGTLFAGEAAGTAQIIATFGGSASASAPATASMPLTADGGAHATVASLALTLMTLTLTLVLTPTLTLAALTLTLTLTLTPTRWPLSRCTMCRGCCTYRATPPAAARCVRSLTTARYYYYILT